LGSKSSLVDSYIGVSVLLVAQEAPSIVSTSATSTSVHVRWTSPFFVGAPLIGYRLSVTAADDAELRRVGAGRLPMDRVMEVLVSSSAAQRVMSEVVTLLSPDTEYTVNVAALNQFGAGAAANVTIRTLPHAVREFFATDSTIFRSLLY